MGILGAFLCQTMHNCSDRVTERRDAIKNAKDAKNAKSANPRRLAFLALLGRAGDLIGAEAGGNGAGAAEGVVAEAKTPQTSPRRPPGTLRATWGKTKGNGLYPQIAQMYADEYERQRGRPTL